MLDPTIFVTLASATAATGIAAIAGLRAWQQWLELRRVELSLVPRRRRSDPPELSELKERVRRLEAIANGNQI